MSQCNDQNNNDNDLIKVWMIAMISSGHLFLRPFFHSTPGVAPGALKDIHIYGKELKNDHKNIAKWELRRKKHKTQLWTFFTCCDAIEDHSGEDDDNRGVDKLVSGANNLDTE